MRNNQKGQAALEAIFGFSAVIAFVMLILSLAYFSFSRSWIEHHLESAAICKAIGKWDCNERLNKKIASALPFGQWQSRVIGNRNEATAIGTFTLGEKIKWTWRKNIRPEEIAKQDFKRWR